jgi:hypothetical protein
VLRTLTAGETMGEDALVGAGAAALGDQVHLHCEEKCHLLFLPTADLEEVLRAAPAERAALRSKALKLLGDRPKADGATNATAAAAAAPAGAEDDEGLHEVPLGGLLSFDDSRPGGPLAARLLQIRKTASAQQRLLSTRLASITATYAQLDEHIQCAMDTCEESGRRAWLAAADEPGATSVASAVLQ